MANYLLIAGNSDIAQVTATRLVESGHRVFLTGHQNNDTLKERAQALNASYEIVDAANFEAVRNVFEKAKKELGELDGVVNFAGSLLLKPAHLTSQEEYEEVIKANLTTAFSVVSAAGKYMTDRGGSVVLLASTVALAGVANHEVIAAAKAGIVGLALSAAASYASANLRFNVIAPGLIDTQLTQAITNDATSRKYSESMHPLGRLGKSEDIASGIAFFLSPENDWITGQVLAIDGGLSRVTPKIKIESN